MKSTWSVAMALMGVALFGFGCAGPQVGPTGPTVEVTEFGRLPDGRAVMLYTLRNGRGMVAKIAEYGGTITEVSVPDRAGNLTNVVLGADNLKAYLLGHPAGAATIGRYANRIGNSRFVLDGREILVTANSGKHHIHGGKNGFSKVLWRGRTLPVSKGRAGVEMTYRCADGEEGYPGDCLVTVTFSVTAENELVLDYRATCDQPTVVNLTNHAYFNLGGAGGTILDHRMQLMADRYTVADEGLIPTGEIARVSGTPLDFTTPRRIGERITELYAGPKGYDHNYIINGKAGEMRLAARASDPKSGRVMECWTTQPGVQFYTANYQTGQPNASGYAYPKHGAFCLETQHYPDSPNRPEFPSTVLRPGQTLHETTKYRFSVD